VSSFLVPRMVDGDNSVEVKFECKKVDPFAKTAELYTFHLTALELKQISEKSSINVNRMSAIGFPTNH